MAMATRVFLGFLLLIFCSHLSTALYEDQVGLADWHHKYIGKVKQAVFHTQKTGRKRVVVSTEENVIASLDLRRGEIFWRHVLGENDAIDQIDIVLGKYVVTLSSEGGVLRAWNLPDGLLIWESILQVSRPSNSLLYVPAKNGKEKETLIFVYGGGWLHAISSVDGDIVWKREFSTESLDVHHVFQHDESHIISVVGILGSQFATYQINSNSGDLLKYNSESFPGGFSGETSLVSNDMLVGLDESRTSIVLSSFKDEAISFHRIHISDIMQEFSGKAELMPSKFSGLFSMRTDSSVVMLRVKGQSEVEVVDKINRPASVSDAISLAEEQAFAVVQHGESDISITVKLDNDLANEVLKESVKINRQWGNVVTVFINNYVRTDKSHGFRALFVMEDHSLVLVQQGEVVWSREDGLASVIDSVTSELPVEKDGVSVAKVEHSLFEWLKSHLLKVKGTLMLASADDLAVIQGMRLKSSEKNKMTRDHNGFRKLIIVLTRAGKILALHTGDGRVVWSLLLPSLRGAEGCEHPSALNIYQWQIPHHHALDENPSILVVGRCGLSSEAPGVLSVIDAYTGEERYSQKLGHSVFKVIPLPLTDSTEQRLHLIIDTDSNAHLYPRTPESANIFLREKANIYWPSVDAGKGIIRGHSLQSLCKLDVADKYCFSSNDLWSVVLPSESEKITTVATRKPNEIVHTQAKAISGDPEVMYKYISKSLLFIASVAPKAIGDIGSVTPDEAWIVIYLMDTITGRILHRVIHQGAQGPINAVVSENWVVYHYFNLRAHRYEMSVIEIYDQSRADNKDVLKLILGKHNLTAPVSSYSRPEVMVKSQSYFFTHSVKAISVTSTAKGITSKQLLIGTINDQILALDKRFVDPRRTAEPTQAEKEEGIIPLTDSLPIIPQSYITHSLQVEGLRGIVAIPAKLESTSLIFSYGVDLFFTRIAPSRTYDSLTEDFSYALLLLTIVALVAAIFVTWIMSEKKELKEKWR